MKKKILSLIALFIILVTIFATNIKAVGNATLSINGNTSVEVDSNITFTLALSNITGLEKGVMSFETKFKYSTEYFEFVSFSSLAPFNIAKSELTLGTIQMTGLAFDHENIIKGSGNLVQVILKAKKVGSSDIDLVDVEVGETGGTVVTTNTPSKTITIQNPTQSSNANLSALGVTEHTLNPSFNSNTTSYNVTVPNNVTNVNVTATAADSKATLTGTGNKTLAVGNNTVNVIVTAEDGTKKTYTITITRQDQTPQSSDNDLKSLNVNGYTISPNFTPGNTNYTLEVPYEAESITVNAVTNDAKASASVTGNSGLQVGNNVVTIKVTAEDGSVKEYKINVTRKDKTPVKDSDSSLKSLDVSGYTLTPSFKSGVTNYTIEVKDSIKGLDVSAIANSLKAKVEVTGNSGWGSGTNNIKIKVTAEDGSTTTYIVTVKRPSSSTDPTPNKSSNNYLKELEIIDYPLSPKFNKETTSYTINVPYDIEKLSDLKITTKLEDSNAKIKILDDKGNVIKDMNLVVGMNVVKYEVTAQDGSVREYIININKSALESKNKLDDLEIPGHELSPKFDPDQREYDITVDSKTDKIDIITKLKFPNDASVKVIGGDNLKEGNNVVIVEVTDSLGNVRTYKINVFKEGPTKILGMTLPIFFGVLGLVILTISLLIALLLRKRRKQILVNNTKEDIKQAPVIEFKPEFNFGSKNSHDDDTVSGGSLNQDSIIHDKKDTKLIGEADYDIYDEIVTKDELYDTIDDAMKTKDTENLKYLLDKEKLNRKTEELKNKKRRSS